MTAPPLTRSSHKTKARPALTFLGDQTLMLGRVHEAAGPSRRTLALMVAGALKGPVIWIAPSWQMETFNATGAAVFCDPGRLLFVTPDREADMFWAMEEALRTGRAPLVVADLTAPPGLTPVRRLHLAAEAGSGGGLCRPLGLLLTPDKGGAQGIETRWHLDQAYFEETDAWTLSRLRARMQPPKSWQVQAVAGGFVLGEVERPLRALSPLRPVREFPSRALPDIFQHQREMVS